MFRIIVNTESDEVKDKVIKFLTDNRIDYNVSRRYDSPKRKVD